MKLLIILLVTSSCILETIHGTPHIRVKRSRAQMQEMIDNVSKAMKEKIKGVKEETSGYSEEENQAFEKFISIMLNRTLSWNEKFEIIEATPGMNQFKPEQSAEAKTLIKKVTELVKYYDEIYPTLSDRVQIFFTDTESLLKKIVQFAAKDEEEQDKQVNS
ncbi:hypothetical protein WR25_26947 [Diploscapter pachys]|uniref:SXP/RAL-2 family protein Ani s 5-like cation-binding domain-containing protein n=1 Tax=Diploscapter pachys TaxID=2018661 RepID=A0A2A2LNT5_9BILA|nr:hypothetical protein WR25_26947 [Diploscapter pachys]